MKVYLLYPRPVFRKVNFEKTRLEEWSDQKTVMFDFSFNTKVHLFHNYRNGIGDFTFQLFGFGISLQWGSLTHKIL